MKKKICFYVNSIDTLGGIQRIVSEISNELIKNYEITILCDHKAKKKDCVSYNLNKDILVKIIDNNFIVSEKIIFFPIRTLKFLIRKLNLNRYSLAKKILKIDYRVIRKKRVINYFRTNKYDYILAEGIDYCIYLSKIKANITSTVIGCWHSSFENYMINYDKTEVEESLKKIDKTIVLTKHDKKMIKETFGVEVDYIYNFINTNDTETSKLNNKIFISVGRYNKVKGYDRLIDVFYKFNQFDNDWKLFLVGDGPERKNLQKQIEKYKLEDNIKLTGRTNDVDKYYKEASIYLMSSHNEGFPMVILEAMKYGLPIIAYYIPVLDEMLSINNYVIKQDDTNSYLKSMIELSNDFNKRKVIGESNEKHVEQFSKENVINYWKMLLK